jgi:hypothetical protein
MDVVLLFNHREKSIDGPQLEFEVGPVVTALASKLGHFRIQLPTNIERLFVASLKITHSGSLLSHKTLQFVPLTTN